jgi:tRNA(adenine34) deaminase
MSTTDEQFMREALAEADRAELHGDVPIGALVVGADGRELARDHNRREESGDPTAHAEVLALRAAAHHAGHWRLEGTTVYATLEPCVMCAGALVNARVARLVYAARDPKAGAISSLFTIGSDMRLNHRFEIQADVLADESARRLQRFFARLRAAGER